MESKKFEKIFSVAKSRGFFWPSSELYGRSAGFFDYGPVGTLLKRNIENEWRKLFVIKEGMFEIETPTIMPQPVFEASGHLQHFVDLVVECTKCGESYRADHLIREKLKLNAENLKTDDLNNLIRKNKIVCLKCKSYLSEVFKFNLMFKTSLGPGKISKESYLRPETAQGMFVSFERLWQVARKKLPFGVCQIGKSYRNEISPRQGMLRLREFTQAEAEIFFNPKEKTHPNFKVVANYTLPLYPISYEEKNKEEFLEITTGEAVKKDIISSEIQAYYLALSEKFFEQIGIPRKAIRARQQLKTEKAHYSIDTWDIEIFSEDFGWVEVAAIADRSDYDLKGHAKVSKQKLEVLSEKGEKFVPHVLEASFGIDRPFYCLLEHSFVEKDNRTFMKLNENVAPFKAAVFPLVAKDNLPEKAREVYELLVKNNVMAQYDEKGSIGKMYARADEIGIPLCVTIDYQTLKDDSATIRERNTTKQERIKIENLLAKIWKC